MTARPANIDDCAVLAPASWQPSAEELKAAAGLSVSAWTDQQVDQAATAAAAVVDDYAVDAPVEVKREALTRMVAYLSTSRNGALASSSLGPQSRTWDTHHAGIFRKCGAQSLLSTWHFRTVGRCE